MLDSSNDTVAILYDIENAPIEMLQYTIDKAQRYQPCRMIIVSDWEAHPEQKRWDRLMQYPDFDRSAGHSTEKTHLTLHSMIPHRFSIRKECGSILSLQQIQILFALLNP